MIRASKTLTLFLALSATAALVACQSDKPAEAPRPASGKSAALRNMEQVSIAAYRCWFGSKDPAFARYSFANELDSMSGRPRFLLVPKNNYGGRPLLVVQAEGASGRVDSFGPLLAEPLGSRINADLVRWSSGNDTCGART
ncbi:hypothetical protein [Tianweitania sediminis]|uniref:Lipoprotein n=2 Tax=Tianweitania sediminis TaxID=1502156 RepID=A0A8J7RPT2_9HYPH|nr:hypothetical protein [Tianweitania sediminis]MBP0439794.1 hypothetical protein [Tianweitania sediminis]